MKIAIIGGAEYTQAAFISAAERLEIELINLDLDNLNYILSERPQIFDNEGNVIQIDGLIVRSTKGIEDQIRTLSRVLTQQGCIMLDGEDRFAGKTAGKSMTSLRRAFNNTGAETFVINKEFVRNNPDFISRQLPLFGKPSNGRKNKGLTIIETHEKLIECIDKDYIIQEKLDIVDEFRVLFFQLGNHDNFNLVGISHKKTIGTVGRNSKTKYKVKSSVKNKILTYLGENGYLKHGLFGIDLALLSDGSYRVIEANRAPVFKRMDKRTHSDTAFVILNAMKEKFESR